MNVDEAQGLVVRVCRKMLRGELSFIEGSRELVGLRWKLRLSEDDEDILTFVAIESDTETIPFGDVRKHWNKRALMEREREWIEAEDWARQVGTPAAESLVARLGN